jgi:aspartate ammonia-lyase
MPQPNTRIEQDAIGSLAVPAQALFGGQTQRAVNLYPLCGEKPLSAYPELIIGLLQVKKTAAKVNMATAELDLEIGKAILDAIEVLLANIPLREFPVHSFHGGGGISSNMNVNEVIANLANQMNFKQPLGSYGPVHPNDHVNLNNSTSDALSTACHLAIINKWQGFSVTLTQLTTTFVEQGQKWKHVYKISRTCLQDAVEITFEDFFSGYASLINRNIERISADITELYKVNLGGNIIGRKGDCSEIFLEQSIGMLNQVINTEQFTRSENLFDSSQNHDDIVAVASRLELLSRGLIKIAKDFRLMCSGPETGFGEITLPAVQPGSSAMPGKMNPTIPEFLIQSCMQAIGRCNSVQMTQDHGELDYNAWQSIVIINLLDAMNCLENGINVFTIHCLSDIKPNVERNQSNINTLIPTLTKLKNLKGYSFASQIYKDSNGDLKLIRKQIKLAE